eukprot:g305.t1
MRSSSVALAAAAIAILYRTREIDVKLAHVVIKLLYGSILWKNKMLAHLYRKNEGIDAPSPEMQALIELLTLTPPKPLSLRQWRFIMRAAIWNTTLDGQASEIETTKGGIRCVYYSWSGKEIASDDGLVIYLHGGAYLGGCPRSYRTFCETLSRGTGMVVCSVDYRLAPECPLPAAVEDVVKVYSALLREGVPPNRIALCGDSAGGGLVLLALQAFRDAHMPMPGCGVPISPWADLTNSHTKTSEVNDIMLRSRSQMDDFALMAVGSDPKKLSSPTCSPLAGNFAGLSPLHVVVGEHEALLSDSIEVVRKARASGVDARLDSVQWMPHIFPVLGTYLPEGAAATARICDFINVHCKNEPRPAVSVSDRVRARL